MPSTISDDFLTDLHDENIVISFRGIFDSGILSVLAQNIENSLSNDQKLNRKLFKIFIELAQNISFYSNEKAKLGADVEAGMGIMIIKEYTDYYTFATGNITDSETSSEIDAHCQVINSLDRDKLREYKREKRSQPHSQKGGANIGLIQVALTSGNPIQLSTNHIEADKVFLSIGTRVNK